MATSAQAVDRGELFSTSTQLGAIAIAQFSKRPSIGKR
jgi:hypothetical protein